MALPGMLELTKEQTQRLVNIIEDKQGCICNVSNSMRTVWITSDDGENELRVSFLCNFALVISRVRFSIKRHHSSRPLLYANYRSLPSPYPPKNKTPDAITSEE